MPNAAGRAGRKLKQLLLIAEVHLRFAAAVAQHERIAELAKRLAYALRSNEWTIVNGRVISGCTADHRKLWRSPLGDLDERVVRCVSLHRVIETRTKCLDQSQLAQEGSELAWRVFPVYRVGFAKNPGAFLLRIGAPEIAEEPGSYPFRFADVNHFTRGREHPVDTGTVCCA